MADNDHDLKYYRKPWMTDDQWSCAKMFASVVGGFHHVCGEFKPCGHGIKLHCSSGGWATFDYSRLTGLVVRAHDEMVRVELIPSGPGRIGFAMWKRHTREGSMGARHPTIEDAIVMHRPRAALAPAEAGGVEDREAFLVWLDSLPKEPNDTLKAAYAAYKAAVRPAPVDALVKEAEPTLDEALAVVCAAMTDGEKWGVAVNAAMPILNADIDQSGWNTVTEVRDAINAALAALRGDAK